MFTQTNKIAPLIEHTVSEQEAVGHYSPDERHMSKTLCQGIQKKESQHQTVTTRGEQRNGPVLIKENPLAGTRNCFVNCSTNSNNLNKANERLLGIPHHWINKVSVGRFGSELNFQSNGLSKTHNDLLRNIQQNLTYKQTGVQGSYVPNESADLYGRLGEKNMLAPLCSSCNELTVQIYPVLYENSDAVQTGGQDVFSVAGGHWQAYSQTRDKHIPTTTSLLACPDHFKCVLCTCPILNGRTICRHYYPLSVICWSAIILTIIIVIAATVNYH